MTKLRLAMPAPSTGVDWSHQRHFLHALSQCPEVEVVAPGAAADVAMVGGSGRPLCLHRVDPHAYGTDYDVTKLLVREQNEIFIKLGMPMFEPADLVKFSTAMNPGSILATIQKLVPGTILCTLMRDPMADIIGQRAPNVSLFRLPIGAPEWIFNTDWSTRRFIDVFFLGAVGRFYPFRMWAMKKLDDERGPAILPRSNIHFYHGEAIAMTGRPAPFWTPDEQDKHQMWYADCLRHAKIFPFCGGIFEYPVGKYFEAMACGTMVLAPMPRDAKILGFRDGVNMVSVTADNFMDKLHYYLDNDAERERIARAGWELAHKYHIHKAQALNVVARLRRIVGGESPEKVEADNDAMMAAL